MNKLLTGAIAAIAAAVAVPAPAFADDPRGVWAPVPGTLSPAGAQLKGNAQERLHAGEGLADVRGPKQRVHRVTFHPREANTSRS
jgi:hypothetical protein